MNPVYTPGVVNICTVFVFSICWNNEIIFCINDKMFVANTIPTFTSYTVNEYILRTVIFSLPVMKSCPWIIANVCNMQVPAKNMLYTKLQFCLGKNDTPLSSNPSFFLGRSSAIAISFFFGGIAKIVTVEGCVLKSFMQYRNYIHQSNFYALFYSADRFNFKK